MYLKYFFYIISLSYFSYIILYVFLVFEINRKSPNNKIYFIFGYPGKALVVFFKHKKLYEKSIKRKLFLLFYLLFYTFGLIYILFIIIKRFFGTV